MAFDTLSRDNIVDFLADIFARRGGESYMGEPVTMSEHMLQAAALAERAGASDSLVAASLLHDIGHYTSEFPEESLEQGRDNYHETAGAGVLTAFFPKAVFEPIELHVAAKRYLCATSPDYFNRLSPASVNSLKVQGGAMADKEVAAFQTHEHYRDALRLRVWDDEGKVPGAETPTFDHYRPLLERLLAAQER
ncbi:HD domain-containing protein [Marinobacter sp. BGYM27]|uniref:HD domain-containing protein n=1 Tax=Marinobacter sp. BGYM27 TaxID=2975597 RepID=UPI0021A73530|nr:HD domain-containing protein [Marinobacter sp. BGYM27]MDG5499626.1 HD domain-containing protein [Marinobacter sp. BGYM27]